MDCEFYRIQDEEYWGEFDGASKDFDIANEELERTCNEVFEDLGDVYKSWFTEDTPPEKIIGSIESFSNALDSYDEFKAAADAYKEAYNRVTRAEQDYNIASDEYNDCMNWCW